MEMLEVELPKRTSYEFPRQYLGKVYRVTLTMPHFMILLFTIISNFQTLCISVPQQTKILSEAFFLSLNWWQWW